jgi:WD40 repeat protein
MLQAQGILWLAAGLALTVPGAGHGQTHGAKDPKNPHKDVPAQKDLYGDPLPEGAMARLGTVRFREGPITQVVAFAPDGKTLASGGRGGVGLILWDVASGRALHRLRNPWSVRSLAFSPDSKTVFVSGSLSLIDVVTGRELRRFKAPRVYFEAVAFSPDGRTVAAGGENQVILWDVVTGNELRQLKGAAGEVRALAFSPDGKTLATGSDDKTVRLWDAATGMELRRLQGHQEAVSAVAFARGGKVLASAGKDRVIRLWDVAGGKELRQLKGHEDMVLSVAFSPDGRTLASGSRDRTIRLWEVATGKEIRCWEANGVVVLSVAFSPNGKTLASAGTWDHAIRLWDTATGKPIHPAMGHTGVVRSIGFLPDGKKLVSHGHDRQILVWDLATGKVGCRLFGSPAAARWWGAAALSKDARILARGGPGADFPGTPPDPIIRLWDTATEKQLHALNEHGGPVVSLAFSPDGKRLASGGEDGMVRQWDVATGKELHQRKQHKGVVWSVAFSPDGKRLASGGRDGKIDLGEVATGKQIRGWDSQQNFITNLVFSPDGKLLASSDRETVHVWDAVRAKQIRRFPGRGMNHALAFSPSGRFLAIDALMSRTLPSGASEETSAIYLWELDSAQTVRRIDRDLEWTWSLAFAPDGRTLASGGNATILLWDLTGRIKNGQLEPARLTAKEVDKVWTDLGSDASQAYQAGWALVAAPGQAVPMLKDRLRPVPFENARRIAQLIADLDSSRYPIRKRATVELEKLAELARPALRQAVAGRPSPETHQRLEQLLDKLDNPISKSETLRGLRAIAVLEQIATPEARAALQTLAKGALEARLTQHATAALQRLHGRAAIDR